MHNLRGGDLIKVRSRSVILSLTQWRKNSAITQQEVADEMDTTQVRISELEGQDDCMLSTLIRYADAVDCDMTFLLKPKVHDGIFQAKKQ